MVAASVLAAIIAGPPGTGPFRRTVQVSRSGAALAGPERPGTGAVGTDATSASSCVAPPLPAEQTPGNPGDGYGVPFVASISAGTIDSGFNQMVGNFLRRSGSPAGTLDPWTLQLSGISGWISGWIDIPSLRLDVADLVFCSNPPPTRPGPVAPGTILFRWDSVSGTPAHPREHLLFYNDPNLGPAAVSWQVSLHPLGASGGVVGVEADGALDVSTAVDVDTALTGPGFTCTQLGPSSLAPTTAPPAPPAGSPAAADPQVSSAPLTGPLGSAAAAVADTSFSLTMFRPASCPYGLLLDSVLAGFDADNATRYRSGQTATDPGWGQFDATVAITSLGLPAGPGAGTALPPDCRPGGSGPPDQPYQLGFTLGTTAAGATLASGPLSASGLAIQACGVLTVRPGSGGCVADLTASVPADGVSTGRGTVSLDLVPHDPLSFPVSERIAPGLGAVGCDGATAAGVPVALSTSLTATVGLFGATCQLPPTSLALAGALDGPLNALQLTLRATLALPRIEPGTPRCPGDLPADVDQLAGLVGGPASATVTVPLDGVVYRAPTAPEGQGNRGDRRPG